MWTSEHHDDSSDLTTRARPATRVLALEAAGLALLTGLLPELFGAARGATTPHPAWIAVLLLAARYAAPGFFAGLVASGAAVAVGSTLNGMGLESLWTRLGAPPEMLALGTCLVVSWVAAWHTRRHAALVERLQEFSDRASEAEEAVEAFQADIEALRERVAHTSTSLRFLRDVAARLEGTEPVAAAEAAADLAIVRTGAAAVAVGAGPEGAQRLLAVRDASGANLLAPRALRDADQRVTIHLGTDAVGVIALWGLPPSVNDGAVQHDLEIIAAWCAPAVAASAGRPDEERLVAGENV